MRRPLVVVTNTSRGRGRPIARGHRHCTDDRSDKRQRQTARDTPAASTRREDVRRRREESQQGRRRDDKARGRGTAQPQQQAVNRSAGQATTRPSTQATTEPEAFEFYCQQSFSVVHDQLPLMLCDGSLAGGAPPLWRPTNNSYADSEQPSCLDDNGIRRRVQVTYRELCMDWTIQYRAIDGSALYLQLLCPRCSRKALTKHARRCSNPTIVMGIFCPYCHAPHTINVGYENAAVDAAFS